MRILIEHGQYLLVNQGDVAMLQVAVQRLKSLWPEATIHVLTSRPASLAAYCPDVVPVCVSIAEAHILSKLAYAAAQTRLGYGLFQLAATPWGWGQRLRQGCPAEWASFGEVLGNADLVLASGGGYLTDAIETKHAASVLNCLGAANRLGKATALVGQGIGPIRSAALRTKLAAVLPRVDFVALREGQFSPGYLHDLRMAPDRILVTGDETVELAYGARPSALGNGIGLNLRVAAYSGVNGATTGVVRSVMRQITQTYRAPLFPVPVSFHPADSDVAALHQLLEGCDNIPEGWEALEAPLKIIQQVGRCRMVITGSYHGAVFALSQGIPAVCLTRAAYYDHKFQGLADQFGAGCRVVSLEAARLSENLTAAVEQTWETAEQVRPSLLEAAERQIELGRAAYRRIQDVVSARA